MENHAENSPRHTCDECGSSARRMFLQFHSKKYGTVIAEGEVLCESCASKREGFQAG